MATQPTKLKRWLDVIAYLAGRRLRRITLPDGSPLEGLHFEAVEHQGNSRESEEEARAVVEVFRRLLAGGTTLTDRKGRHGRSRWSISWWWRPTTRRWTGSGGPWRRPAPPNRAWGTSTSSRGRRPPWQPTRLRAPARRTRPGGWSSYTPSTGSTWRRHRCGWRPRWWRARGVLTAESKRPEQMRMVNAVLRCGEMSGA